MEKFRYENDLSRIGETCDVYDPDSELPVARAVRTQIGDIIDSQPYGGIYRVVSYSPKSMIANVVKVTDPRKVKSLEAEVRLADLIRGEDKWISGEITDEEFEEYYCNKGSE
jgi:hypothetical protein